MTMSHKEALAKAIEAFYTEVDNLDGSDMEAAIRAYVEARGLVMVPREPTESMVIEGVSEDESDDMYRDIKSIYSAMLAAAPDPFEEGE